MLSRAFVTKHQIRRNFNDHEENSCRSMSIYEYEEFIIGFKQDVPLVFFDENNDPNRNHGTVWRKTFSLISPCLFG